MSPPPPTPVSNPPSPNFWKPSLTTPFEEELGTILPPDDLMLRSPASTHALPVPDSPPSLTHSPAPISRQPTPPPPEEEWATRPPSLLNEDIRRLLDPIEVPTVAVERNSMYYLDDGVVFQAGNTYFRVPRYMLLQESENFKDQYNLPPAGDWTSPGTSDSNPVILEGVDAVDFFRLLCLLYPKTVPSQPIIDTWSEKQWKSIMTLASRWNMANIRSLAVERLSACASSITKLHLGKQYYVSKWVREGYLELCIRKNPIAEDEASKLDWRELVKIAAARERIRLEAMERIITDWQWVSTKYGYCKKFVEAEAPVSEANMPSKNRLIHEILDEIFQLEDSAEGLESRSGSETGSTMFRI
ncbi:hypothetical protein M422DRAFT_263596 [Sphaerobolus stellatus SS14]|uniref:BTB domain-containing protein n=1 Tax=Sphaerobolus stellatus (strain SS14) TaxID=990650 RepID=A0A0C9UYA3_SPHS4|nr:hypothetical protein M422DRAFT_263596 [Sphaerobolus stellatus SS14]